MSKNIDIDYVSNLARLDLSAEEKQNLGMQLENVLDYFESLNAVDVSGVEPIAHAFDIYNVWGEDQPGPTLSVDEVLMNAPSQKDNQISVPIVVEGE